MDFIAGLRDFLSGKKSYLVSASGVITALIAYANGSLSLMQTIVVILGALGLTTIRAAITKLIAELQNGG